MSEQFFDAEAGRILSEARVLALHIQQAHRRRRPALSPTGATPSAAGDRYDRWLRWLAGSPRSYPLS